MESLEGFDQDIQISLNFLKIILIAIWTKTVTVVLC